MNHDHKKSKIRNDVYFYLFWTESANTKKHLEMGGHNKYLQVRYLQAGMGITGGLRPLTGLNLRQSG